MLIVLGWEQTLDNGIEEELCRVPTLLCWDAVKEKE